MGRKLNLSHLTEEECEQVLHVLQKDFELRQKERERIGAIESTLNNEKNKTQVLSQQNKFNRNCCIRCCQVFGLIFNRRRQCYACGFNVCRDCCDYDVERKKDICHFCAKEKALPKQTCSWFYNTVSQRFRRFGSAKVVRSLYKTTSYSDTEVDRSSYDPAALKELHGSARRSRPSISDVFDHDGNEGDDDCDDDGLRSSSAGVISSTHKFLPGPLFIEHNVWKVFWCRLRCWMFGFRDGAMLMGKCEAKTAEEGEVCSEHCAEDTGVVEEMSVLLLKQTSCKMIRPKEDALLISSAFRQQAEVLLC
ncbi:hypothetical protein BaRGS_00002561 [Batillaria attramentaria]|uniref:RabBD domain-containing protein n=1 Tax=Batillaria attramentaria TaxID=370345 RepID=A0ABD0M3H6_9CAEN